MTADTFVVVTDDGIYETEREDVARALEDIYAACDGVHTSVDALVTCADCAASLDEMVEATT